MDAKEVEYFLNEKPKENKKDNSYEEIEKERKNK